MNQGPFNPYNAPNPYQQPPPGGPMGPPGYAPSYGYEFSDDENAVISKAAYWARLLGVFMIISGVGSLYSCNVISFAIDLAVGITFIGAATSLKQVVDTQGNDIQHMMTALGKLRSAFKIRVIVAIVALVIVLALFALIMALVIAGAATHH